MHITAYNEENGNIEPVQEMGLWEIKPSSKTRKRHLISATFILLCNLALRSPSNGNNGIRKKILLLSKITRRLKRDFPHFLLRLKCQYWDWKIYRIVNSRAILRSNEFTDLHFQLRFSFHFISSTHKLQSQIFYVKSERFASSPQARCIQIHCNCNVRITFFSLHSQIGIANCVIYGRRQWDAGGERECLLFCSRSSKSNREKCYAMFTFRYLIYAALATSIAHAW